MTDDPKVALGLDETYDSCVAIRRPHILAQRLTTALRTKGVSVSEPELGPVTYKKRIVGPEGGLNPSFFAKDVALEDQKEFRIVWQSDGPLVAQIIPFHAAGCGIVIVW